MTLEQKILELRQQMSTGGIEGLLLPETRARLQTIAEQSSRLQCEVAQIAKDEAARLSQTPQAADGIANGIALFVARTAIEVSLRNSGDLLITPPDDSILDRDTFDL
jgi:hypothetical protein